MIGMRGLASQQLLLGVTFLVTSCVVPMPGNAQIGPGKNAICTVAFPNCLPTAHSPAFIDASGLQGSNDLCAAIYNILQPTTYPATGEVIDARGISSGLTCTNGTSPWFETSHGYINVPSTILLPSGIIKIPTTWVLPSGTTLVGQETTDPLLNSGGATVQTTIQATTALSSGAMIQYGDATHCPSHVCSDISVEHLTLDGNNQTITGILNQNSQDATRVDHVTLYRVLGTGLSVGVNSGGGDAHNSGPYSNIHYDTGASGVFGSVCASINCLARAAFMG